MKITKQQLIKIIKEELAAGGDFAAAKEAARQEHEALTTMDYRLADIEKFLLDPERPKADEVLTQQAVEQLNVLRDTLIQLKKGILDSHADRLERS